MLHHDVDESYFAHTGTISGRHDECDTLVKKTLDVTEGRSYNLFSMRVSQKRSTTTTATAKPAAMWSFAVKHGDIVAC